MKNTRFPVLLLSALFSFANLAFAAPLCSSLYTEYQLSTEPVVGQYGSKTYSVVGLTVSGQPILHVRSLPSDKGSKWPLIRRQQSSTDCLPTALAYAAQILRGYDFYDIYPSLRRELGTAEIMRSAQISQMAIMRNPFAMFNPSIMLHGFAPPALTQSMKLSVALTGLGLITTPSNASIETIPGIRARLDSGSIGLMGGAFVAKRVAVKEEDLEIIPFKRFIPATSKDASPDGAHTWLITDTFKDPKTGNQYVVLIDPNDALPLLMSIQDFNRISNTTLMWLR